MVLSEELLDITEEWRQVETSPLLIPLIIHQTLKNADVQTLRIARLVCTTWEEEASKILIIKKSPILISNLKIDSNWRSNHILIDKDIGAPEVLKILQNLQKENENRIKFLEIQTGPWTSSHLSKILNFLPHLEELTFSGDFVLPKHNQLSSPQKKLRKLHTLHLNLSDDNLQNLANVEFLLEFYKLAPNLKKITCFKSKLTEPGSSHTTIFSKLLFRSITSFFSSKSLLCHLDINVDLRNEDLELLQRASLPLKFLHLPLDSRICATRVNNLLQSLSSTLTQLKITYRNCATKAPALRSLQHLEYFSMFGTGSETSGLDKRKLYRRRSSFGIGFAPRNWFDTITDLSSIFKYTNIDLDLARTIHHIFNTVPANLFPDSSNMISNTLKELKLSSVYYLPKDVFNLKFLFPNLNKIRMSFLDDNLLRSVFNNFPLLDTFCATEGFFTDAGLTGICPEVEEIMENSKSKREFSCGKLREFPSLLSLSKLKTLELASPRVTNFGVINGVAVCTFVQELTLNFPQMDNRSLLHLTKQKFWDTLILKSGSFSPQNLNTLRLESKGRKFSYEPET